LAATIAVLVLQAVNRRPTGLVQTMRFVERLPASVEGGMEMGVALANDGSRLVIPLAGAGFLVRDLAESDGRVLSGPGGTIEGWAPFLSPDGRWIAFQDEEEQQLRRVSIDGGVPIPIADGVPVFFGGSWGPDNTIVYVPNISSGLWRVAVEGGTAEQITVPDRAGGELGHWFPQILPGGEKVLFSTYRPPLDSSTVEVVDLETQQRDVLFKGAHHGRYVPTGHIVFMRRETMWAVPFDLSRLQATGPAEPVLEDVAYLPVNAQGAFAIADNGTLAYIRASDWNVEGRLVWVDRDGTERPVLDEWGVYLDPSVSPDGGRVAYQRIQDGEPDIWVIDTTLGGIPTRITRNDGLVDWPVWTRNGTDIIYSKEQPQFDLFRRDWRAGAPAEELSASPFDKHARSVSPDGLELAYSVVADSRDIWILQLEGPPEPRAFRATEYNELDAHFSPDGRWLAYQSDESGRSEIWLESYPDGARGRRQISREGGLAPRWGAGGELFYRQDSRVMAVQIDLASGSPGIPSVALDGPYRPRDHYDVSPDGQRFLMIKPRQGVERRRAVTVVLNWFEELKAKVGN
jgi:serine/threonine-protein kinase